MKNLVYKNVAAVAFNSLSLSAIATTPPAVVDDQPIALPIRAAGKTSLSVTGICHGA